MHVSAASSRGPRHTNRVVRLQPIVYHPTGTMLLLQGIGSGQRQLIAVTCIAEYAYAATYTNAHALAKPQAEPYPMPSAAGKRVGRVLAGCSKPEAGDKPGLPIPGK